jgi:hypothetical protein
VAEEEPQQPLPLATEQAPGLGDANPVVKPEPPSDAVKPEDGAMKQPAARPPVAASEGVGPGSRPTQLFGAMPASSAGSVQPSATGSVLTATRAPKVRIKLPRSSGASGGAGGSSGGGAVPGDGGEPAAKRSRY